MLNFKVLESVSRRTKGYHFGKKFPAEEGREKFNKGSDPILPSCGKGIKLLQSFYAF